MALNKSQTSTWMKVLIIVLAVMMALLVLLPGITSMITPSTSGTGSTPASGTAPAATSYEGISQQHASQVQANEAALAKSPKSFDLLVAQANAYFDWAYAVLQQQALAQQGLDQPLWKNAVSYYQRALAANAKFAPSVMTDYAIALHYSGNGPAAITELQKVLKLQPDFPQANLNRAFFAESQNDTATAVLYYGKYIKLNPANEAQSVAQAKSRLAALQGK